MIASPDVIAVRSINTPRPPYGRLKTLGAAVAAVLFLASGELAGQTAAQLIPDPYPDSAKAYLVAVDDQDLWARQPDVPRPAASLVKLLTVMLALEEPAFTGRLLSVSKAAANTEPRRAGLIAGDSLRAADALRAMLVSSANDACVVVVEALAPTRQAFAAKLNARARQLGMTRTHFVDACGYDAPGQQSTARDMLTLARAAMALPFIANHAALKEITIRTTAGRSYRLRNTNQLLGRLDGAIGLKTGYTSGANQCLIAVTERRGRRVWLVMLGSDDRWLKAHGMIVQAFAQASRTPLVR